MQVAVIIVALVVSPLLMVLIWLLQRWRHERRQKEQAIANAHAVTQWTKKVIIERQEMGPDAPVCAPVIRIEKQKSAANLAACRSRLGSDNTTFTTISEYEIPLDTAWEFPREQLHLEKVIGEGAFGKVGCFAHLDFSNVNIHDF